MRRYAPGVRDEEHRASGRGIGERFEAKLWRYEGEAAWFFVTLPIDVADALTDGPSSGFGSVKVVARIGDVGWSTSIFPDRKSRSYVLPVKKQIRRRARIDEGDLVQVHLERAR